MEKNKWYTSVWAIVIFMYLFFPVGIAFCYLRLKDKYGKYMASSIILYWFGVCWGGVGLLYLGLSVTEPTFISEYLAPGILIFVIPGGICFYFGNKRKKKNELYNKYIKHIKTRRIISIDTLCNLVNEDYDTLLNNITDMISKEIIDAYLQDDEIIMRGNLSANDNLSYETEIKKETKIVKCKECGAKNTLIIGQNKECEYCGTLLQ